MKANSEEKEASIDLQNFTHFITSKLVRGHRISLYAIVKEEMIHRYQISISGSIISSHNIKIEVKGKDTAKLTYSNEKIEKLMDLYGIPTISDK